MCKKSLLLALLMALFAPWAAHAQTTVEIGDGTATCNTNPIGTYYNYSITEQLYTAEEIGTAGTISSISFYYKGIAAKDLPITVYMKHVDEENLASAGITLADADEVFTGTLSVPATAGWVTIDLATPFAYDGTSNLLIGFIKDYLYYFSGQSWQGTATTATMARYTQSDSAGPYTTSTVPSNAQANRPNIQIVITPSSGPTCDKPSTLNVADITGFGATCTWENTGAASYTFEWKKASASDWTVVTGLTANTYALSGLEPMTAYSVRVKAVCGTDLESGYKSATFTTLDVCPDGKVCIGEGTSTNQYLPTYGFYNYSLTQQIYSAEEMGGAGLIESVDFYCTDALTRTLDVYMVSTDKDVFESTTDWIPVTSADLVYSGSVAFAAGWNTITFANPFIYMGRTNVALIVDDNTGDYTSGIPFYVFDAEGNQTLRIYSDPTNYDPEAPTQYTGTQMNVKNRVRLGVSELPSCLQPSGLAVSNIGARSVELSWTENGEATAWQIGYQVVGGTEQYVEVSTNPYTLTGLTPDTDYEVRVQSKCSDTEYSTFTSFVSFTTEPSCYAPTDMVISDITAFSANVAWTSENTNIEMRYSPDVRPITTFDDSQMHGWTNIDADGDGYEWVLGSECGGIYLVEGGSLAGTGHNSSADMVTSGSYSNFTGDALTPDNYLVSPQITLGGSITFWACAQDGSYAAEHFGVAVSTTGNTDAADFTTIAEWTFGSRSANVLRSSNAPRGGNRDQAEWVQYTVDLSAYSGQGYVAIRHFDCTDMFMLNVDDINIEQPGFEMPWVYVTNPASPQALSNLEPETTYLVQVRANCGSEGYSQWLEGSFTTLPACMVPTDLVVSNIDKRSADLAWTSNGEETAWQISLNDGTNEQIFDATATTYSFTGLTPETRYIVKVRAVCDATLQSNWSSLATFTTLVACPAPTALAISDITNVSAVATWTYDGDVELEYAEDVWKYYDNGTFGTSMGAGGTIYWGILLTPDMLPANQPLTHIAMYENDNNANPTTISIYSGGDAAPGTFLYSEEVTPVGNGFHEIALAEPVEFDATQNLWIVCYNNADTYPAAGSADLTNPNGRWVSLDGEEWADIDGYGYNYTWMIRAAFGNNTQTEWVAVNNPASPQTITGLTPETNYLVRLRAVCGGIDGESVWVTTSFTTDIACPAPEALGATPYANSAVLSWEGISESYTVSYRESAVIGGIDEKFATSSAPTGWTMYTGLLSNVMEDPTALVSATYGWTFGTGNGVFDSHARCNIYSNYQRWLVTPAIEVPAGAAFSFDMALTAYSGTVAAPATTGTDDKFVVLVSTDNMATWTILRQWDNAGSEYVYNNIANTATGEQVSFDFSAYAGQTVYVAFYGESTTSNADNNLHIDNVNVTVAELVPAGEWMTVDADEAAATLTGLTPETKYEWKVQGNCGEWGMSEESAIMSFTTTNDACPVPTNLTVNNETITATTADLSWEGSPDVESFTVRYRVPEHAAAGSFYETFDVNSIPAGWTRYSGLVDDVVAGTATLTSTTSGWNFSNTNVFGQYHAKVNIYGTSCKYWLVTPEVTPTSGTFTFDLALTAYNSANAASGTCDDDRFVVLVYANETWTILREWNNTGSDYVYNTIATTGEAVSIDLSAYVGQAVQIAFYGESTVTSNGDNDLHIDNVLIGTLIPATEWQTVTTTDMNVTLTGLTPETTYEAQVKADCSDPEAWSNTVSFTTPELTIATQTLALSAGTTWVSFNVETTLNDLKAALVEAVPGTVIVITGKTRSTTYSPANGRWSGNLPWDVANMYKIKVVSDCEITLQGMPVDPAEHPVNIVNGANWVAFPLAESMSLTDAFAGFAANNDQVLGKTGSAMYIRGRWQGTTLTNLQPGQGYVYKSATSGTRVLTFPSNSAK